MKCSRHPKYKGGSKPRRYCEKCWEIFEENNPESDWNYERFQMRCDEHKRYQGKTPPDRECDQCWKYYHYRTDDPITKEEYERKKKIKERRKEERKRKRKLRKKRRKRKKEYKNKLKEYIGKNNNLYKMYKNEYKGKSDLATALINNFVSMQSLYHPFTRDEFEDLLDDILSIDKEKTSKKFMSLLENNIEKSKFNDIKDYFFDDEDSFFIIAEKLYTEYLIERYIEKRGQTKVTNFKKYYDKLEKYYES